MLLGGPGFYTNVMPDEIRKVTITAISMDDGRNVKCPRCLHYHPVIENFDNLCDRCQQILLTHFPNHPSVEHIKIALEKQRIKYAK